MKLKSVWRMLCGEHAKCIKCGRYPSGMTQMIYTECRAWCHECYGRYVEGRRPIMEQRF